MAQQVRNAAFQRKVGVSVTIEPVNSVTGLQVITVQVYDAYWEEEE